ncbi:MAG: hypothetical protein FWC64_11430 [Treponema sp.]|nr:hypothetical protein [Treponema sp.]
MSDSGKAGNGHGNNRRRPFRRRGKGGGNARHEAGGSHGNSAGGASSAGGGYSRGPQQPKAAHPSRNAGEDRKAQGRHEYRGRQKQQGGLLRKDREIHRGPRPPFVERPKWVPPKVATGSLPTPDCPWCGKPIQDISFAIADKDSGVPVHFDCVAARLCEGESLERGEAVVYIGGGRFGVVHLGGTGNSQQAGRDFSIKKIIEWEDKEKRAEWRSLICDRYSVT